MTQELKNQTKEIILEKIKDAKTISGRNSMGVSESFYNPYFLIKEFKKIEELKQLTEKELNLLIEFADYATDIFY